MSNYTSDSYDGVIMEACLGLGLLNTIVAYSIGGAGLLTFGSTVFLIIVLMEIKSPSNSKMLHKKF